MSSFTTLTLQGEIHPHGVCSACNLPFTGVDSPEPIFFTLPCGCMFDLPCLSLAFQLQLSFADFFDCPNHLASIPGPVVKELKLPSGEPSRTETGRDGREFIAIFEGEDHAVTGRIILREDHDEVTGMLALSVKVIHELVVVVR